MTTATNPTAGAATAAVPGSEPPTRSRRRTARYAAAAGLVLLAAALPALTGPYLVVLAAGAIVLALLAISTQLLAICGLPSFGQTALLGVGAYTAALLADAGLTNAPMLLAACAASSAVAAAMMAPFVLRTRATTFLMVTVMIQGLAVTIAVHATSVTGGDEGRHTPPLTLWPGLPLTSTPAVYWFTLAGLAVTGAGVAALLRSRLVLLLRGHAAREARMTALGHRPTLHLGAGYALAAAIAGAGGCLHVAINNYVSPADISFTVAASGFIAAALGTALAARPSMRAALAAAVGIVAVRDLAGIDGSGPLLLGLLCVTVPYLRPAARRLRTRHAARTGQPR